MNDFNFDSKKFANGVLKFGEAIDSLRSILNSDYNTPGAYEFRGLSFYYPDKYDSYNEDNPDNEANISVIENQIDKIIKKSDKLDDLMGQTIISLDESFPGFKAEFINEITEFSDDGNTQIYIPDSIKDDIMNSIPEKVKVDIDDFCNKSEEERQQFYNSLTIDEYEDFITYINLDAIIKCEIIENGLEQSVRYQYQEAYHSNVNEGRFNRSGTGLGLYQFTSGDYMSKLMEEFGFSLINDKSEHTAAMLNAVESYKNNRIIFHDSNEAYYNRLLQDGNLSNSKKIEYEQRRDKNKEQKEIWQNSKTKLDECKEQNKEDGTDPYCKDYIETYFTYMEGQGVTDYLYKDLMYNYQLDKVTASSVEREEASINLSLDIIHAEDTLMDIPFDANVLLNTVNPETGENYTEVEVGAIIAANEEEIIKAINSNINYTTAQRDYLINMVELYKNDAKFYEILLKSAENKFDNLIADYSYAEQERLQGQKEEFIESYKEAYNNSKSNNDNTSRAEGGEPENRIDKYNNEREILEIKYEEILNNEASITKFYAVEADISIKKDEAKETAIKMEETYMPTILALDEQTGNIIHLKIGYDKCKEAYDIEQARTGLDDLKDSFLDICNEWGEGFTSLINGEGVGELVDAFVSTGATIVVGGRALVNGVLKIGEYAFDGLVFLENSLESGIMLIYDTEGAKEHFEAGLDYIRIDQVKEADKRFYNNNPFGKWISENSTLAYDGKGAQALQDFALNGAKIVLATAATVVTGGAAAPIIIGALYGIGEATEGYTQSVNREAGEEYNLGRVAFEAAIGGVSGATEFYGYGQLGSMIYQGGKHVLKNGFKEGIKLIRDNFSISPTGFIKRFGKNMIDIDNLIDSGLVVVDHLGNVITGDETIQQALVNGGKELLIATAMNAAASFLKTNDLMGEANEVFGDAYNDLDKQIKDLESGKLDLPDAEKEILLRQYAEFGGIKAAESELLSINKKISDAKSGKIKLTPSELDNLIHESDILENGILAAKISLVPEIETLIIKNPPTIAESAETIKLDSNQYNFETESAEYAGISEYSYSGNNYSFTDMNNKTREACAKYGIDYGEYIKASNDPFHKINGDTLKGEISSDDIMIISSEVNKDLTVKGGGLVKEGVVLGKATSLNDFDYYHVTSNGAQKFKSCVTTGDGLLEIARTEGGAGVIGREGLLYSGALDGTLKGNDFVKTDAKISELEGNLTRITEETQPFIISTFENVGEHTTVRLSPTQAPGTEAYAKYMETGSDIYPGILPENYDTSGASVVYDGNPSTGTTTTRNQIDSTKEGVHEYYINELMTPPSNTVNNYLVDGNQVIYIGRKIENPDGTFTFEFASPEARDAYEQALKRVNGY